jgi:hypothetical protein
VLGLAAIIVILAIILMVMLALFGPTTVGTRATPP